MNATRDKPNVDREERVVVVDRLANVRSALFLILSQEPAISIVGDRASVDGLPEYLLDVQATILLLDWTLTGDDGANLLCKIRAACPGLLIIALSPRPEDHRVSERAGANAFVCKGDEPDMLLNLIRGLVRR
ncbi:MAG TPA: hypothetical protein VHA53_11050 [Nitrolancea sp.]|nr:hypothetical protein [Nitrolancea sp.]